MRAFQTLRMRRADFALADFELLTAALSVLEWRSHNGTVKLVTDSYGLEYIQNCGLVSAWDEVSPVLDGMDELGLNEEVFWAGAKLYALAQEKTPCVMVDLDFILWRKIDFTAFGNDIAVIHREAVNNEVYPDHHFFRFRDGWQLPPGLDWSVEACNTALAYFGSQQLVERYVDFAFEFMRHAAGEGLPYMVFAEQRWLAMLATARQKKIFSLSTLPDLFDGKQRYFTHVWGHKSYLRENPSAADKFCRDCAERLCYDFPKFAADLSTKAWAAKYFA